MSSYHTDLFDCYIKEEYRKTITEVQRTKSWYSFVDIDVWEPADEVDHDYCPYFPFREADWDEETGRFRFYTDFNTHNNVYYYKALELIQYVLERICEDDKPLYYAMDDEVDDEPMILRDLRGNRSAQVEKFLEKPFDDFSEYEKYFENQPFVILEKPKIPEGYFITAGGSLYTIGQAANARYFGMGAPEEILEYVKMRGLKLYSQDDFIDENGKLVFPEEVRCIEKNSFKGCKKLRSIELPEKFVISEGAFEDCENLESVKLSHRTVVGARAFSRCTSLKEIDLPVIFEETDENYEMFGIFHMCIKPYAFFSCKSLERVTLPPNITSIGTRAFAMCESLKSIDIPESVVKIKRGAFCGCKSLEKVVLPAGLQIIENEAFNGCTSLVEIIIPESVRQIGEGGEEYYDDLDRVLGGVVFNQSVGYYRGTERWFSWAKDIIPAALPNLTIKGKSRSCAHVYAVYNGIKFEEYDFGEKV